MKVGKLNVDDNPRTAQALGIQSIPTLLLYRDGNPITQMVGAAPKATFRETVIRKLREH